MKLTDTIEITVSKYRGPRRSPLRVKEQVPAKIYGPLAVHRDVRVGLKQQWKVTHVATGLRITGELTQKAAVAIAKELKDLPQWHEPTLGEGRTAANAAVFEALSKKVNEAMAFHVHGYAREVVA